MQQQQGSVQYPHVPVARCQIISFVDRLNARSLAVRERSPLIKLVGIVAEHRAAADACDHDALAGVTRR